MMNATASPRPVMQKTTVKDEPLQLERVPSTEPCVLNYQQVNPVLLVRKRPWLRVLLLGLLVQCVLAVWRVVVNDQSVASAFGTIAVFGVSLFAIVLLAKRIVAVAICWLTAAPQIDRDTLGRFRNLWSESKSETSKSDARPLGANTGSSTERVRATLIKSGCQIVYFGFTSTLALAVCLMYSSIPPQLGLLAFVLLTAGWTYISMKRHGLSPTKLRFYLKLTVTPLASPQPPWVLVPSPGAAKNFLLLQCVFVLTCLSVGLALARAEPVGVPHSSAISSILSSLFFCIACAALSVFSLLIPIIPTLKLLEDALDPVRGTEAHPAWTALDGYSERLRHSPNPLEQDCLLFASHPTKDFPYLLQGKLLTEHLHIVGPPGTGKTSIGLASLLTQQIRRGDGAVIVIDCKGDPLLFHTVRQEAAAAGRSFKWFTNIPNRSTYIFNPFDREIYDQLTMPDAVGLLVNSLNLSHGTDYGRAWFSTASRILLKRAYEHAYPSSGPKKRGPKKKIPLAVNPIESFADLNAAIQYLMKSKDGKQYEAARHLSFVVEQLAEYEQLNLAPNRATGECPAALENAISMPHVLRNKEVVYFYLGGLVDSAAVGELGRLALFSLLTACQQHFDTLGATRAYCVIDEAQSVVAQNIANVLAKARSYGLSLTLAHQSMGQLFPPGGADLRELVTQCTAVKQIFACRDPWMVKHVSAMSGQVRYLNYSYETTTEAIQNGTVGIPEVLPDKDGVRSVKVVESVGDRLTPQDIQEIGFDPNRCILAFEQSYGFTQYLGYFPGRIEWTMAKAEAERRAALPWPSASADTITIVPNWPSWPTGNAHTITPKTTPAESQAVEDNTAERLERLKSQLDLDSEM